MNRVRNKVRGVFLLLGVCIFFARHSSVSFCIPHETERSGKGEYVYNIEDHVTEAVPDDYDYVGNYPYIDYDYIEQYHEVLWHNIYAAPRIDYESTPLAEYLQKYIDSDKELLSEEIARTGQGFPLTIDYTAFDFNDDGLEDYMVCFHRGRPYSYVNGKYRGNDVMIFMQEKSGALKCVLNAGRCHLHDTVLPNEHAPVAILREKTEGYYSIVLPGQNCIWRYNDGRYAACEIEERYVPSGEAIDAIGQGEAWEELKYSNMAWSELPAGIDYEYIEVNHKILRHNICMTPRSDYNDTVLEEYLREDIEEDREKCRELEVADSLALTIDYFPFDFNDDGLEDYMVCYHGILWQGQAGNHVDIYVQRKNGTLRRVFSVTMRLHLENLLNAHAPVAVLDEKTDGFYAIVLPGSNRILRYNKETCRYEFQERE